MRRPHAIAIVLLTAATSAAAAQDAVQLRLGGRPGESNRYHAVMDVFMRGGQMAAMMLPDTTLPFMHINRYVTRGVTTVSGDTITVVETVDSLTSETPAMPQMSAMMGASIAAQRGQQTTTRLDSRGRIFSIDVANPNSPDGAAPMGGPGRGGPRPAPGRNQRMMFVLPERAVRPGDTWTDSILIAGAPGEGPTNYLATYRLDNVLQHGGSRVAVISMNGTTATNGPNGPTVMSTGGEIQLDVTNRRIASFTLTMSGMQSTPQGDVPVRMHFEQSLMP